MHGLSLPSSPCPVLPVRCFRLRCSRLRSCVRSGLRRCGRHHTRATAPINRPRPALPVRAAGCGAGPPGVAGRGTIPGPEPPAGTRASNPS
ncbi:hypothetical protein RC1_3253 [Rhodospirillum centenum SW]|uniref:Uncharacterized protein n=1 Tax=Rhodospirillum centenum (strain ATCC 51521 / SW) TaxID=414684 RepID=B6IWE0_RHOCS|nr:hypothetical protein RC1_3253 [Rhodospirillum centenum SW]